MPYQDGPLGTAVSESYITSARRGRLTLLLAGTGAENGMAAVGAVQAGTERSMPDRKTIDDFLAQQHVAVVGVSRDPKQFANGVYRRLRAGGRVLYPVNAAAGGEVLEGDLSYVRLADVPDPVDGVLVMVPAQAAADVVVEAVDRGIPRVWLHRGVGKGSVSPQAMAKCHSNGIAVVDGACPLMFEQPVRGIHHLHRLLAGRRIAA